MQPGQYDPAPSGIDYLNQISTPPPSQGFDKKTKLIIIVLALFGVVSLAFIFFAASNTSKGASPLTMAARLQSLQSVSETYNKKLRDSPLQAANSSLIAVLTTANTSIKVPLASYDIDPKKQAKEIAALDPTTELEAKLDEAYLNYNLDTTYAHEMNVLLTKTLDMMKRLQKTASSTSMQEFLTKTISDLTNIQKQFAATLATD